MLRSLLATAFLFSLCFTLGCGGGPPAEASGEAVPDDYADQQAAAQQQAMEDAMKKNR